MTRYKLLALDMDGTLLNEAKEISADNKRAIAEAQAAGVTVMLATGRGIRSIMPYVEELGLTSPIVAVNGSEVWSSPDTLLRRQLMDPEHVRRLHALAVRHDTWWWAYAVDRLYNRDEWTEELERVEWLKFGFYYEDVRILAEVRNIVEGWNELEVTNSHPYNIELNPLGVSKASGLAAVCELLGIAMDEVVAMGDSENDVAMLRAAGLGVAMGNAQDSVKLLADRVTVTNEEHGVAEVIRGYMLV